MLIFFWYSFSADLRAEMTAPINETLYARTIQLKNYKNANTMASLWFVAVTSPNPIVIIMVVAQ